MADFTVYPAIDLRRGRVVRLAQGDPERETMYSTDPGEVARRWVSTGADWLHVVSLDGALDQEGKENLRSLVEILASGSEVQFGGGLRELAHVQAVFELGVGRVVFGTAAVEDPGLIAQAIEEFGPARVALAVDSRDDRVHVHGWQHEAGMSPLELVKRWDEFGLRFAIVTDIARDGMGRGLNLEQAKEIQEQTGLKVIASGGVATVGDVRAARAHGLNGVIIGRAIYDGRIQLEEALRC